MATPRIYPKPTRGRILVRRLEVDEAPAGGIIRAETAKEKPLRGEVLAVGEPTITDNGTSIPMNVKAGDVIVFGKFSGHDHTADGEEFIVMRDDEVFLIL